MERSQHVLFNGEGATDYAVAEGLKMVPENYFTTLEKEQKLTKENEEKPANPTKDTVGVVALNKFGNLAAATFTDGLTGQQHGRSGESPLIGCGTYANKEVCAVSCIGDRESIIWAVVTHEVYALLKYKGLYNRSR